MTARPPPLVPTGTNLLGLVKHAAGWPAERAQVTLHRVMVHVISDLQRHAGHADLVRELVDGSVGLHRGISNLPDEDATWWESYRQKVEEAARRA